MKTYALYCNGMFVSAKPFFAQPVAPSEFGVGGLPTSCYDIVEVISMQNSLVSSIPATIDVGSQGLA